MRCNRRQRRGQFAAAGSSGRPNRPVPFNLSTREDSMHPCLAVVFVAAMLPLVALAQDAPELPGLNPPDWLRAYKFEQDKFTFVRIRYDGPRGGFRGRGG